MPVHASLRFGSNVGKFSYYLLLLFDGRTSAALVAADSAPACPVTASADIPISIGLIEWVALLTCGLRRGITEGFAVLLTLVVEIALATLALSALAENNVVLGEDVAANAVCSEFAGLRLFDGMVFWGEWFKVLRVRSDTPAISAFVVNVMPPRDGADSHLVSESVGAV